MQAACSRRQARVHWNAATDYPHLEAHLLDVLEMCLPLPTDLCLVLLSFLDPAGEAGRGFRSCLPLPRGCALLEVSKSSRGGSIQLRRGCEDASYQLPFHGGGYLHMEGPLFDSDGRSTRAAQAEKPSWHVLHTVVSLQSEAHLGQIRYHDIHLVDDAAAAASAARAEAGDNFEVVYDPLEWRSRKKRRIELQQAARRDIHQQKFAYYQILPAGCGINLLRDPSDAGTIGLVRGVCLLYAHQCSVDSVEGSALYSIEAAKQTPLSGANHTVKAYFRPRGICEWNGGQCNRHGSPECANACCSAAHCAATSRVRRLVCNFHLM